MKPPQYDTENDLQCLIMRSDEVPKTYHLSAVNAPEILAGETLASNLVALSFTARGNTTNPSMPTINNQVIGSDAVQFQITGGLTDAEDYMVKGVWATNLGNAVSLEGMLYIRDPAP